MKVNTSRMWRSGIAMLLALCLVVGFFPVAAFATDNSGYAGPGESIPAPEEINYVSIGDSMSNGYGFTGYYQGGENNRYDSEGNPVYYDFLNGDNMYGAGAYPLLFESYLEDQGYAVNHTKLAVSALLPEDLLFLLGGRDEADDDYAGFRAFIGNNSYDEAYTENTIKPHFQNAVTNADIITMCIGNGTFGAFMMGKLVEIVGLLTDTRDPADYLKFEAALEGLNDEQKAFVMEKYEELRAELQPYISNDMVEDTKLNGIIDLLAYCGASLMLNYKGNVEKILEMNPDVEIILLGLLSTTSGLKITDEEGNVLLRFGDAVDTMMELINAYFAALPALLQEMGLASDATIYYAELPEPKFIADVLKELGANEWSFEDSNPATNPNAHLDIPTFRQRSIDGYNGGLYNFIVKPMLVGMLKSQGLDENTALSMVPDHITMDDIASYKADAMAFLQADQFRYIATAVHLGIEDAVVACSANDDFPLSSIEAFAKEGGLMAAFGDYMPQDNVPNLREYTYNFFMGNLPEQTEKDAAKYQGMCMFYAMFKLGDGLTCHPSPAGHVDMYNAVVTAYESKHTVQDETMDNLKAALEAVVEAVKKYGPEAGKAVWERWEEMGYVGEVEAYIDELIDTVEVRYDYYANEALPAIEAAIDALKGEKDVLVAELDELNAQLAKKKAELEAVINGIEIGSIYIPEINIDPIGGNEQTEVPAYDCEVEGEGIVAELEAAIRDLEHAIAVVEALIADVDADLADMAKLAAQIADAVKELNKTYESIVVAAEDLYDAFKAIEEVLTNDADQSIEAVTSAFEAARSTALAALDVLEVAMGYARELDADILAEVDNIVELAESLYNKFISEDSLEAYVAAIVEKVLPQMTEEEQLIVAATAAILKKIAPEAIAYAEEQLPIKIEELKAECRKEIEALIEEYKPEIEKAEKELEAKWEEIKPQIEAKYEEAKAELEAEYEATVAALEAKRAELIAELIAAEAELKAAMEELKGEAADKMEAAVAPLKAQIARLEKDIATVAADLAHAAEHFETALKLAYEEAKIAVMALYNEAMAQLNKAIEDLKAQLQKDLEALENTLKGMIEEAVREALDALLGEIKKTVEELKNALIAMGIETLEELVDTLVALFNELLYKATHADLVIDEDFKYVALGDGSAAADGYAEALKAYLAAEAAANGIKAIDFVNAAKAGNTVAAEAANLSAEIADADLITLGFSQADMLANAITAGELDWTALVGAEAVPYIEEALAKVTAGIDALELPEEMKAMLSSIVEAYAYNAVEYTINLPALLQAIREVNEDAVVIVVGMYNPIDGVSALGQDLSAFAEYFDYIVEAAGAYGIGLAMLTNELDYVAAAEVEIEKAELSLKDLGALLEGDLSAMYPSANGDAYIAEQIENALTLSFEVGGLWGDADGDGVVTPVDAMLVLQYYVGSIDATELNVKVSDVDGDAEVSPIDAMLILQYYVGDIAKFPVEG